MKTLWDVMDHYNRGGEISPYLDGGIVPLDLSDKEIDAMVAFMFTLTDDRFAVENRNIMGQQRKLAASKRPFRDMARPQSKILPFEYRTLGKPGLTEESPR